MTLDHPREQSARLNRIKATELGNIPACDGPMCAHEFKNHLLVLLRFESVDADEGARLAC